MIKSKSDNPKKIVKKTDMVVAPATADALKRIDAASVATLPHDWTPKRGGPILAKYLKEQECKHNSILEQLNVTVSKINGDIDKKVKENSEGLLNHIQRYESNIIQIVDECNSNGILSLGANCVALKRINSLYSELLEEIFTFRQQGMKLENNRVDKLRKLMRENFQQVFEIGRYPPTVLNQDFNDRMYEMNHVLYDNLSAYDELETELKYDAEEKLKKARSALSQLCVGTKVVYRSGSACPHSSIYSLHSVHESSKRSLSAGQKKRIWNPSIQTLQIDIDRCVDQLMEAYRQSLINLFRGFKGQLKFLRKNLTYGDISKSESNVTYLCDLATSVEEASGEISKTVQDQDVQENAKYLAQITEADVYNIQRSLASLGECLRYTYSILYDAGHLCDSHVIRTAIVQKLTITAVEEMLTNNDSAELANEVTFNLSMEKMISAEDEAKLKVEYENLTNMLNYIKDMCHKHHNAEIARLEEYMTLPPLLINVLLAEFRCFLENNPKNISLSASNVNFLKKDMRNEHKPIPHAILQTELQKINLDNWRNGFLEGLQNSVRQIPEELTNQAKLWVEERARTLKNRSHLKLSSHNVRAERIKALYEKRLAELRYHKARLESHLNAIHALAKVLPEMIAEDLSIDDIYPLSKWTKSIEKEMQSALSTKGIDPEVLSLKMSSYAIRLVKHRQLFEKLLEEVMEFRKLEVEHRFQNARISNVRYLGVVTLFHEKGEYSVVEADEMLRSLMKASEDVEKGENQVPLALENCRAQMLAKADQMLLPLKRVTEGFVKAKVKKDVKKTAVHRKNK